MASTLVSNVVTRDRISASISPFLRIRNAMAKPSNHRARASRKSESAIDHFSDPDPLETILALIKQMEATLVSLQELRNYVGNGLGQNMLDIVIEEFDSELNRIKRKVVQ